MYLYLTFYIVPGNAVLNEYTSLPLRSYSLRIDMEDFNNETGFAHYALFSVGLEYYNFPLSVGGYTGTVGEILLHCSYIFRS